MDAERLFEVIEQQQVTVLAMTAARGRLLAEASKGRDLSQVRYVHFSGDALLWQDVSKVRELVPDGVVLGVYGSSETQRAVSHFVVPKKVPAGRDVTQAVPLGRGIKDVQILVLNEGMAHAGIGELGGLYVRSPHLAGGYLKDEELTQKRFVSNPFTGDESDRMYSTGEMARYLPDGQVQFVRREEERVNIRGYRIELGEVEAVLRRHERVTDAAVIAREFGEGGVNDERLVAYVVGKEGVGEGESGRGGEPDSLSPTSPTPNTPISLSPLLPLSPSPLLSREELRGYLLGQLPEYMVPGYVEFLDAIPLMSSGKVNRRALPEPDWRRPELGRAYLGPRTETEGVLVEIWAHLLHLDRVGVHDNFFELGGHSLLATQVVQRLRDAFRVEVPLRSLFESSTVADLAELIDTMRWAVQEPDDPSSQNTEDEAF